MPIQGQVIVSQISLGLTTADSVDLVIPTYQLIGAGTLYVYARGSAAATPVLLSIFVNGMQILRRTQVIAYGTTGALDTSAHLLTSVNTMGGRIECIAAAASGTPTVDLLVSHAAANGFSSLLASLWGAVRGR